MSRSLESNYDEDHCRGHLTKLVDNSRFLLADPLLALEAANLFIGREGFYRDRSCDQGCSRSCNKSRSCSCQKCCTDPNSSSSSEHKHHKNNRNNRNNNGNNDRNRRRLFNRGGYGSNKCVMTCCHIDSCGHRKRCCCCRPMLM